MTNKSRLLSWTYSLASNYHTKLLRENILIRTYQYKKLSYRRETARQLCMYT